MYKIVFMGTPEFSVPTLEKLIEKFDVKAVLTQPDRPKGRGKKIVFSPVKEEAVKNNITVFQPQKLRKDTEIIEKLKAIKPDFIIVVAYGQILSKEVLDMPKYACINLHASLLPKLRGAAPINWAIINGEKVSGNTTMIMNDGIDTGDILLTQKFEITPEMTFIDLYSLLMKNGADLVCETIEKYAKGEISPIKQDDSKFTYAPMLSKETGKIHWDCDSDKICNLIRGLNSSPLAYTTYKDKKFKIHVAKPVEVKSSEKNGTILKVDKDGILVKCKDGGILIKDVQFPGKRSMRVEDYIRGNSIEEGCMLI